MDVFARLRGDILAGALAPSQRLKIEDLCTTYDTSLSPIREALSLLTSERLVERIDQRGFRVAPATLHEFDELLDTRCWLEERALRESMRRASPRWEEELVLAHHRLVRLERSPSKQLASVDPNWEACHRAFHVTLLAGCGSTILLRFCEQLYDMNIRYRQIAGVVAYPRRNIKAEHQGLVEAALAHDADTAVARLVDHYRRTGAHLRKALS
jgi:GntR family transcriptional regulator, carbon starvation induced regulator